MDNYYKVLELEKGASLEAIKKAYRTKAKMLHPDMNKDRDTTADFIKINEAYIFLKEQISSKKATLGKSGSRRTYSDAAYYKNWQQNMQAKAQAMAKENAKKKYEEFKKTTLYKSAQAANYFFDSLFILVGIIMIISPISSLLTAEYDPETISSVITATIASAFMGVLLIYLLVRNIRNK